MGAIDGAKGPDEGVKREDKGHVGKDVAGKGGEELSIGEKNGKGAKNVKDIQQKDGWAERQVNPHPVANFAATLADQTDV